MLSTIIFSLLAASVPASAHVAMSSPLSFNDPKNPNVNEAAKNYNLASPVSGSTYPCNTDNLALLKSAKAVETWQAGSSQSIKFPSGGAAHGGGSCEVSISEDDGQNFIVLKKVIGQCPQLGGSIPFDLPSTAKGGRSIIAWSWFNLQGNREMYMNCAVINVEGGSGSGVTGDAMFVANVEGKSPCKTKEGENPDLQDKCCRTGAPSLVKAPTCSASSPGYNSAGGSAKPDTESAGNTGDAKPAAPVNGSGSSSGSSAAETAAGTGTGTGAGIPTATGTGVAAGATPSGYGSGNGAGAARPTGTGVLGGAGPTGTGGFRRPATTGTPDRGCSGGNGRGRGPKRESTRAERAERRRRAALRI